jgi:hypothetical protein
MTGFNETKKKSKTFSTLQQKMICQKKFHQIILSQKYQMLDRAAVK